MRRTPNRGEGIVTYFALVNKSGKSTLISLSVNRTIPPASPFARATGAWPEQPTRQVAITKPQMRVFISVGVNKGLRMEARNH